MSIQRLRDWRMNGGWLKGLEPRGQALALMGCGECVDQQIHHSLDAARNAVEAAGLNKDDVGLEDRYRVTDPGDRPTIEHRCLDCSSPSLRILHRRVKTKLVYFWYCVACGAEGGDKQTLADAVKDCEATS